MATNIIMPSLGFDMTEGKLARWLKQEGDPVKKGEAIAEIETEKATVEIEATSAGVLRQIKVQPDHIVPVGTVIGIIAEPQEAVSEPADTVANAEPVSVATKRTVELPTPPPPAPEDETRVRASPLARKMAQAAGIDLKQIAGTGPNGRIMERDVEGATVAPKPMPSPAPSPALPRSTEKSQLPLTPLTRIRQAIARRMTESKATAPHFYITIQVNMTKTEQVREQLNGLVSEGERISINDFVVAAVAKTLIRFPNFNASYRDGSLEMHSEINIGVAVALDDGIITPVLRNADQKGLKQIAVEARALSERARGNRLRADDLGNGTFTISNLGMFGVDEFIAIINPPEAAILAVGTVTKQPIVVNDTVQIAPIMKLTLSTDHRVADGAQASRFLQDLKKTLENPISLLLG